MDNECLVTNVDDATHAVAGVEGCAGTRIILHGPMVVTVLDILYKWGKK